MQQIALIISSVFEPMILVYGIAILGGLRAGLSGNFWNSYFWSISMVMGAVAVIRLYFKKRDKTNWDISDRKKRIVPLAILLALIGIIYITMLQIANPQIATLFGAFFIWVAGFFVLTFRVKLSGHVAVLTWFVCNLVAWFGTIMIPTIILIPLLAWSRLALKRHVLSEVVIGFLYSILVFFVSSRIIG